MDVNDNHKIYISDDDDLLEEIPDRYTPIEQYLSYNTDRVNLILKKDDSGLETGDSIDMLKGNYQFNHENHDSDDSVIEIHDDVVMPQLTPMPVLISVEENKNLSETTAINSNEQNEEKLPELFPIPQVVLESKTSSSSSIVESQESCVTNSRRSSSSSTFIDNLLEKIRRKTVDSVESESCPAKVVKSATTTDDELLIEIESPIRYRKSNNPNMLATPFVQNQRATSVFVNSDEEYKMTVAKHKHQQETQQKNTCKLPPPPKMRPPKLPANIQKPRTVAEKRVLVNSNLDFLTIEQESKIYKQIQLKESGKDVNHKLIDKIQAEDIPINYGAWKALIWLRTMEGNYIHQYISVDGLNVKLIGSRGNHREKFLPPQTSQPFPKFRTTFLRSIRCCEGGKIKKRIIDNIVSMENIRRFVLEESLEPYKRLETKNLHNQLSSIAPRPLGKKIEFINKSRKLLNTDEDSVFLGNYMKFKMPDVKLQVTVQKKIPLHPTAKQYLNEIIPYRDMNENWINFSLSTLTTTKSSQETADDINKNKFEFVIPYHENKNNILVREVLKSKEDNEKLRIYNVESDDDDDEDDIEWTFAKNADKNDSLEMDIVDVIKDLTNSVFININDDLFTQDDPHDRSRISSVLSPIKSKEATSELSTSSRKIKDNKSRKMLNELKRLNANVFKSDVSRIEDEDDIRRHATAHLGREERELRPTVIVTDSDTVLLGNKDRDSRRTKRLPKKFNDYLHPTTSGMHEADADYEPPKKVKVRDSQDETFKPRVQANNSDIAFSHEEIKSIRQEVQKWLHVNVEIRRLDGLEGIQPWCMFHGVYKCLCKSYYSHEKFMDPIIVRANPTACVKNPANETAVKPSKSEITIIKPSKSDITLTKISKPEVTITNLSKLDVKENNESKSIKSEMLAAKPTKSNISLSMPSSSRASEASSSRCSSMDCDMKIDTKSENSRRVLPVELKNQEEKQPNKMAKEMYDSLDDMNTPKMEILNLCELVNGGFGPIFINIYDTRVNRLNSIFRSILNNKSALAYIDGLAFFIDIERVDIMGLKFDSISNELEHPIFIIMPKANYPSPISSTMSNDFTKLLFKENSDAMVEIRDKLMLKEVADIIEIILQSVRKKIELQIDGEPSKHVKDQLSMITRDRSNSGSSASSANTSPLHFNGRELNKAPAPGFDTPLMKEFNRIFSIRMQRLCAIIKSNSLGLRPLDGYNNKFYLYRWDLMLQSFEEDMIQIWQATLISEKNERYLMLAITDNNEEPEIANVESIVNIKKLSLSNHMTELTRMILLRVENAKTKHMTILLYGCKDYFRVCGILNSKDNFLDGFVAKPTRTTNPRLTAKVQKVYNIWYGLRKSREVENEKFSIDDDDEDDDDDDDNDSINDISSDDDEQKEDEISIKVGESSRKHVDDLCREIEEVEEEQFVKMNESDIEKLKKSDIEMLNKFDVEILTKSDMDRMNQSGISDKSDTSDKSNIKEKENQPVMSDPKQSSSTKFQASDNLVIKKISEKTPQSKYKWFLFNISNDFSHIFIKHWKRYLPFTVIMDAIYKAKTKQKTVQLIGKEFETWPKIYALPSAPMKFPDKTLSMTNNYLLFGPYLRNASPNLLLMQNVDGVMHYRDSYEKMNNIIRRTKTKCLWIYANSLRCVSDISDEKIILSLKKNEESDMVDDDKQTLKISSIMGGFYYVDDNNDKSDD